MTDSDSSFTNVDPRSYNNASTVGELVDKLSKFDRNRKIVPSGLWYLTFTDAKLDEEDILLLEIKQIYKEVIKGKHSE